MIETDLLVVGSGAAGLAAALLDDQRKPIAGLYAPGNDMTGVMGGAYSGAGITIGPALTFGYIAARHAVSSASR